MLEFSYLSDAEGVVMWDDENKDNKTCYLKMFSKNTLIKIFFCCSPQLVLPVRRSLYRTKLPSCQIRL